MKTLVISGPTGSGKTDFAFRLGEKLKWRLVNADAFQFYREVPILSNQPQKAGEFDLLGDRSLEAPISAGDFSREVLPFLNQNRIWVGTGLYLGAGLYGLDPDRRKGTPFQGRPRISYAMIVLNPPRKDLYARLDERVDSMIQKGALGEAEKISELLKSGSLSSRNPVLKAIGLKHLLLYIGHEISFEEAVRLWKRDTRRLAKRQWTWLRKFCPPSKSVLWAETGDDTLLKQSLELTKSFE